MKKFLLLVVLVAGLCLPMACNTSLSAPANAPVVAGATPCPNCPLGNYAYSSSYSSGLSEPYGVLVQNQNLIVTDYDNSDGEIFGLSGNFISYTGNSGSGHLSNPEGIAVGPGGIVYVADLSNNRIAKFDSNGNYVGQIYNPSGISLGGPTDVAVDPQGNVYSTAADPCDVYKISPTGTLLLTFASSCNSGAFGGVENPTGIALDGKGHIILADQDSGSRLVLYDANTGAFVNQINAFGRVNFWNNDTTGNNIVYVKVDTEGFVYVTDNKKNEVLKGDLKGNLYAIFGNSGSGTLNHPEGLALDGNGNVYVADEYHGRVVKFSPH